VSISLGDELVRSCWRLLAEGFPQRALECAERALRLYEPPADSLLAGRLMLVVGIALHSLGSRDAAKVYLEDASWALENAREVKGDPEPISLRR
jgi:hypothetical protein